MAQADAGAADARELQACIRDLTSLLALPALWLDREPAQIVAVLLDAVVSMLRLDFAYLKLDQPAAGASVEAMQAARPFAAPGDAAALGRLLKPTLFDQAPARIAHPLAEGEVLLMPVWLGLPGETGVLVAASRRPDFPTSTEALLLRVAANQTVMALQEAQLRGERERAEAALVERAQLAALGAAVGLAIAESDALGEMLQRCAAALVEHLDAAFARVWTLDERTQVLELQASAGMYTHLTGAHSRVPVGSLKIGLIAQERKPHLTNAVIGDPRVSDQAWARREGMVAFAGYPLIVEQRLVGVMALFARHALSETTLAAMASIAHGIAVGIERKWAELERQRLLSAVQLAQAEAELERSRLREVFQQAPAVILVLDGPAHVVSAANPLACAAVGRSVERLLGMPLRTSLPELEGQGYFELLDQVYQSGEPYVGTELPVKLDRYGTGALEDTFFSFVYQPLRDAQGAVTGILVHAVEVTEQVRSRQAVEALAAERQAVLAQITDGVVLSDATGHIIFLNDAARQLGGGGEPGMSVEALRPPAQVFTLTGDPYPPEEWPLVRAVRRAETVRDAAWCIRWPDEREVAVEGSATPIVADDGGLLGAALVFRDVTVRQQLQRQQDAFLASTSHDLKNPLSSVRGIAQLLQRQVERTGTVAPERLSKSLEIIEAASMQLTGQIDELLDVARLRMGRSLELNRQPTDLVALVRTVVAQHAAATERHDVRVEAPVESLVGDWDAARVRRLIANLVSNALKYSPAGGDVIVRVQREQDGPAIWATLSVADRGIGIPAADLPHLFLPFRRAQNAIDRFAGTGIGLAAVRQIVEQHGGAVTVESQEGVGSIFTARLPLPTTSPPAALLN